MRQVRPDHPGHGGVMQGRAETSASARRATNTGGGLAVGRSSFGAAAPGPPRLGSTSAGSEDSRGTAAPKVIPLQRCQALTAEPAACNPLETSQLTASSLLDSHRPWMLQ